MKNRREFLISSGKAALTGAVTIAGASVGIDKLINPMRALSAPAMNWNALVAWIKSTTMANVNTLTSQVQAFNRAWASLVNKINTQAYVPTSSDLAAFFGTGSTSLSTLMNNLQTTAGNYIQFKANLAIDNCAVGQNGVTPYPSTPGQSAITEFNNKMTAYGVGAPNNPGWWHFGNGWGDYYNEGATFEGLAWASILSGGVTSAGGSGNVAASAIVQGPSTAQWPWTILPGAAQQVDIHNANDAWALSGEATTGGFLVYQWDGTQWHQRPGGLTQIAVGTDGEVWGINNVATTGGFEVYRWNGSQFVLKPGGLIKIYVGSAGHVWGINDNYQPYYWNGSTSWTETSLISLGQLSVAGDGTVLGTPYGNGSTGGNVAYQCVGGNWSQIGQNIYGYTVTSVYAISSGQMFIQTCNTAENILQQYVSGSWSKIATAPNGVNPGFAEQYVGKDGSLWSYLTDPETQNANFANIYHWTGSVWQATYDTFLMKVLVIATDGGKIGLLQVLGEIWSRTQISKYQLKCGQVLCGGGAVTMMTAVGALLTDMANYNFGISDQFITVMEESGVPDPIGWQQTLTPLIAEVLCTEGMAAAIGASILFVVCNCGAGLIRIVFGK